MKARHLPEQPERVETGPVKFGDDWTGVFIRGDNAAWYAMELRMALDELPETCNPMVKHGLQSMAAVLESCIERPEVAP